MNKQEIEIAIEIIASDKKAFESVNHGGFTNKIKAFGLAISALEKQIPKKPIRHQPTYNFITCPVCNTDLIHTKNYCTYCGQAIDWGREDE